MKRFTWWTLPLAAALVVGLLTADLALAAKVEGEAKAKKEKGDNVIRGEYAILASECNLTPEQKEQLAAKLKASQEALAQWKQENAQKAKDLQAKMKAAKEANNKEEAKNIAQELKILMQERERLSHGAMEAVYSILTDEQKAEWNSFRLYRHAMMRYKKLGLSEDQTALVRALADQVAGGVDPADKKAAKEAMITLAKKIEADVLSPEQHEKLSQKGNKKDKKSQEGGAEG